MCHLMFRGGAIALLFATISASAEHRIHARRALTEASSRPARAIADEYTKAAAIESGLGFANLPGLYLVTEYRTEHNGVTHFVYKQQYDGMDVVNAAWVVNVDREGRVLNAGGTLVGGPAPGVDVPDPAGAREAAVAAVRAVNATLAERVSAATVKAGRTRNAVRFESPSLPENLDGRPVWFALNGSVRPAWQFTVTDEDGVSRYATVVDSVGGGLLSKEPLTWFQAPPPPRGLVFTGRSPQAAQPGVAATEAPAYVQRELVSFAGDPTASPKGWTEGNRTAGNNIVAGSNIEGITFLRAPYITTAPGADFQFPLELGPGTMHPLTYRDAAITNLFYWANRIHDLFYSIGFNEAAGNYQADNFGKGGVGGDPLYIYAHFGAASTGGFAQVNNAFYSTSAAGEDGTQAMVGMFLGSSEGRWADGAYSTETIIHEYTHGVSLRLIRNLFGHQGGAMGEAFSDFWAHEFITPEGAPVDGVYPYGEYLYNTFGVGIRSRPYSTNMEINPLTYRDLGRASAQPAIHNDGGIWVMALWETRANMIRQFGEREGRRRLRLNVMDGMKLSPPNPSMLDVRDAILLADRTNFRGESQSQIWEAFAKRGMGALAYSPGADTILVKASFDRPSAKGLVGFTEEAFQLGEQVRVIANDENATAPSINVQLTTSSGDLETLVLRRAGSSYTAAIGTTSNAVRHGDRALSVIPGDYVSVYYLDPDTGSGAQLVEATVPVKSNYAAFTTTNSAIPPTENERVLFRGGSGQFMRVPLPFPFPFYERTFGELRIYNDGLSGFDTALPTGCSDTATLLRNAAAAPMFVRMRTNGTAQQNEGVYFSQPSPDAVMVRWAGETDPAPGTGSPQPLNFAAILRDDGRIEFRYGQGNTNVASSISALIGCGSSIPVVGISKGNGLLIQTAPTVNGRVDFTGAPGVNWMPPFNTPSIPTVRIENPEAGNTYRGVLNGRGIAHDDGAVVSGVFVLVDGVLVGRAISNVARPDVCGSERLPGCPNVGFTFSLNFANLGISPGAHNLRLRVVNTRGAFVDYPEQGIPFNVDTGDDARPVGAITSVSDGAEVSGPLQIAGHVYSKDMRVTAVDVVIDGVLYGRAQYNMPRTELCAGEASGSPNCPGIGFNFNLNPATAFPTLMSGEHLLQVRALDEAGRVTLIPETPLHIRVVKTANQLPVGVLTSPTNLERLNGTVRVSGHAYDPDGRITRVELLINGEFRTTMPYGSARSEVCAGVDVRACPNIGFEMDFNSRILPNGLYTLGIRLVDDSGSSVIIPRLTGTGINIRVEN